MLFVRPSDGAVVPASRRERFLLMDDLLSYAEGPLQVIATAVTICPTMTPTVQGGRLLRILPAMH